jgi:hypothetical protein
VNERIQEAQGAVQAVIAARREGEARLAELKRSLTREEAVLPAGTGAPRSASSEDKALRSLEAIARVTGVPSSGGNPRASQMNELERLHRDQTVEERLIPSPNDQNSCAQSRKPMDMMVQGRSMSLFQAAQQ